MITVGIIGPITPRGEGNHAVECLVNIAEGIHAGGVLIAEGFAPFCPMLDYQYLLADFHFGDDALKAVSLEWIRRCDCVLALPGWKESAGAKLEADLCALAQIPVFESIGKILEWRKGREAL